MDPSQSMISELETPVWAEAAVTSVHLREPRVCKEATILPRLIIQAETAPGSPVPQKLASPLDSRKQALGACSWRQFYFMMNGTCMQSTCTFDLEEAGR